MMMMILLLLLLCSPCALSRALCVCWRRSRRLVALTASATVVVHSLSMKIRRHPRHDDALLCVPVDCVCTLVPTSRWLDVCDLFTARVDVFAPPCLPWWLRALVRASNVTRVGLSGRIHARVAWRTDVSERRGARAHRQHCFVIAGAGAGGPGTGAAGGALEYNREQERCHRPGGVTPRRRAARYQVFIAEADAHAAVDVQW